MECFKYAFNILTMTGGMLKTNNSGNIRNKKNTNYGNIFTPPLPLGVYTFTFGMTCYRGGLGLPCNAISPYSVE
jgi:hypothetical protein